MKFGQLTEYNVRNVFLQKSYTKCGGKAIPRPFYRNSNLSITVDQQSEMLQFAFIVCPSGDLPKYIKIKKFNALTTCFDLIYNISKKQKEV